MHGRTVFERRHNWHIFSDFRAVCHLFMIFFPPQTIQQRGGAVIKARKLSSAMSAAKAICDHMKSWWFGTAEVSQQR